MKRYVWQPLAFFGVGFGFYIYNGICWNAWRSYLFHIITYAVICLALMWALYKKDKFNNKYK